jgi:hypothetical protein
MVWRTIGGIAPSQAKACEDRKQYPVNHGGVAIHLRSPDFGLGRRAALARPGADGVPSHVVEHAFGEAVAEGAKKLLEQFTALKPERKQGHGADEQGQRARIGSGLRKRWPDRAIEPYEELVRAGRPDLSKGDLRENVATALENKHILIEQQGDFYASTGLYRTGGRDPAATVQGGLPASSRGVPAVPGMDGANAGQPWPRRRGRHTQSGGAGCELTLGALRYDPAQYRTNLIARLKTTEKGEMVRC